MGESDQRARLAERRHLAREIHDRVLQRLAGVSLALGVAELRPEDRARCRDEMAAALDALRDVIHETLEEPGAVAPSAPLSEELELLRAAHETLPVTVSCDQRESLPEALRPLLRQFLAEALRNAAKHARPTSVEVRVRVRDGQLEAAVENDGVRGPGPGMRFGLRLAGLEASERGGCVESGRTPARSWRTRLAVPL